MFNRIFNKLCRITEKIGIDPRVPLNNFKGFFGYYLKDYYEISKQMRVNNSEFKITKLYPIHSDRFSDSGTAKGHYFHQDLLVARRLYEKKPQKHLDIGSRIDGFVAHVACYREIHVLDIRPLENNVKNIAFKRANLMEDCPDLHQQYDSISSLHAIEHFGLGRYGDPIDIKGSEKGIANIYKILKPGGIFYFSVPIGPRRIEFNAHRVFDLSYLIKLFENKFKIIRFSYVDDKGELFENVTLTDEKIKNSVNCYLGCGIFELIKEYESR